MIGRFDEALRRACDSNQVSTLYELVALASVIQCEIQSVYPYIDYTAGMKIMNPTYKPRPSSTLVNGHVVIFWYSNTDEVTTRLFASNGGVWSSNHFVPLVKHNENLNILDNNQAILSPKVSFKPVL